MSGLRGYIIGDSKVIAKFETYGQRVHDEVFKSVNMLRKLLTRKVKEKKLSGQVLKNRTGRLRRSIHDEIYDDGKSITATTGTNVEYAKPHEFGFQGTVEVKEHYRMMKKAWGRPVANPREILVRAHAKRLNLPERSFLRSSLWEMSDDIHRELKDAAWRATRG